MFRSPKANRLTLIYWDGNGMEHLKLAHHLLG